MKKVKRKYYTITHSTKKYCSTRKTVNSFRDLGTNISNSRITLHVVHTSGAVCAGNLFFARYADTKLAKHKAIYSVLRIGLHHARPYYSTKLNRV